jgi:tetratricopeptide (TPR) repeat protein
VLENTLDASIRIQAYTFLMKMKTNAATAKEYQSVAAEINALLTEFGITSYSLPLQLLQANFVTFTGNNPELGKSILKSALELRLNKYETAKVKMQLADILLYEEKYNQALIYYSQIEEDLKNDEVGHEASLMAAKTSYFKGDFDWALKQFKTLKSASTQLIANDALEYFLLITDNTVSDSTQTDLKKFAKADYLLYQNKLTDALAMFKDVVAKNNTEEILDVSFLRMGRIHEKLKDYPAALAQYQEIIDKYSEGIYIDEALYFSANIYRDKLNDPEKAKSLYEKVLFNHQDSIYFIESRRNFRELRGDTNL